MEGVLIRPQASSLTRRRRSQIERPEAKGMRQRCRIRRGTRMRTSEATSRARYAEDNTASGRCSAEEPSIGAPPGPRVTPTRCPRATRDGRGEGRSWRFAVKRSSTRVAHQTPPGIGQSRGCSLRESVAEIGETHLSPEATPPSRDGFRPDGIARGDPPTLDGAGPGSRRATGCGVRQRT